VKKLIFVVLAAIFYLTIFSAPPAAGQTLPDKQIQLQWIDGSSKGSCVTQPAPTTDGATSGTILSSASSNFLAPPAVTTTNMVLIVNSPFASDVGKWPITAVSATSLTTPHSFRSASGVSFIVVDPSATACPLQEDRFLIERGASSVGPFSQHGTVGTDVTKFVDSPLPDASTFCYQVRAGLGSFLTAPTPSACLTTQASLILSVSGNGSITSSPAGINCGSACSANFAANAKVTLTAVAASGFSFAGWGGACSGTGTCAVTMDAAKLITANFSTLAAPTTLVLAP